MKKQFTICQQLAWEPYPTNNPVGRKPVKEGKSLPNSVTEDVGGFSLMPNYSAKQLRRINRQSVARFKKTGIKTRRKFGGRLVW